MRLRQCRVDGCYAVVTPPGRYCPRHQGVGEAKAARDKARDAAQWDKAHAANPGQAAVWRSGRWRKMRAAWLKAHPSCVVCGNQGTSVDHIVPHRGDVALAYDAGNLQTLCHRCHFIKTRAERGRNPYPVAEKRGPRA
jgi:5-methylcytosine-specific restriction enzyme A